MLIFIKSFLRSESPEPPGSKRPRLTLQERRAKVNAEKKAMRKQMEKQALEQEKATRAQNEKEMAEQDKKDQEVADFHKAMELQEHADSVARREEAEAWKHRQAINPDSNPLLLPQQQPPQPKKMCPVCKKDISRNNFVNHLQTSRFCRGKHGLSIEDVQKKMNAEKRREKYWENPEAKRAREKEASKERYWDNPGRKREAEKQRYWDNPEGKRVQEKEAGKQRYWDNPERKREAEKQRYWDNPERKREAEKQRYWDNPEQKREAEKQRYWDNPEHKREAEKQRYWDNIDHKTSREALQAFRNRAIHGPIFICVCCAEYNFRSNVLRVKSVEDVEKSEFLDQSYWIKHRSHFTVLDSYWVCMTCQEDVNKGKLPKSSTRNIPSDETPDEYKDMTDIENCLLAPVIVFVKLHNLKNQLRNTNKIVACPVSTNKVFENLKKLQTGIATLVRSAEYDRKIYSGQVRPVLVRNCLKYLVDSGYRHYGNPQQAENLAEAIRRFDLASEDADLSGESFMEEEEVESDAVDDQRVRLDCVATAFLPDKPSEKFSPAAKGEVSNMTQLRDPYSQMFPPRFPSGIDIHRDFDRGVTEAVWLKHKLCGIDAWFSKNPLFLFTAAYRLDFQKISSTLHAIKGNIIFLKISFD